MRVGQRRRNSPQETRSPAPWASSGCLQSAEGTRLEAARTLSPARVRPPWSPLGMVGLLQHVDSHGQTYLDMWGCAEDKDDSLGHIFGFETLRAPGERGVETRAEWIQVPSHHWGPLQHPYAHPNPPGPVMGWLERWGLKARVPFPLPSLNVSDFSRPRGRPHLYVFVGGSCLLRVLVMEFEGELCLHESWRDALGQQRGPAQEPNFAPPPPQSEASSWGGWRERMEATGPQLQ